MTHRPFNRVQLGSLFQARKTRVTDELPILSVTIANGVVRRDTLNRKMETNLKSHEHLLAKKGDIAYNMMRMWQGASGVAKENGVLSPAYVVCAPKPNTYSDYFAQLFRTPLLIKRFQDYAYGITGDRLRLYFKDFEKILVDTPPYDEQREIALILETWDRIISLTEQLHAAKMMQRKSLMQRLLSGRLRIPGFSRPWQTVRLGDVFSNRSESGHANLSLLSITRESGVVFRDTVNKRDTSSKDKSRYIQICPGDIGYNTMRMWQGISGLSSIEGIVSPAYTIVTPDSSLDAEFMAVLFKYPPIINLFRRYSQGLVNDTLNLKFRHFSEIKVTIPEREAQTKIALVFRIFDQELSLLKQELDLFKEQKKGMMQQLLSGKKRLKVTEAA